MASHKPTIDDVARLAGVGRTTVSRVVNQGPFVRQELRDRVLQAVETLGYRVNAQARNLASGANRELALIHSTNLDLEPNSYYSAGLELGAMRACTEEGFQLTTHSINQSAPGHADRLRSLVREGRYRGIVLTPPYADDVALIAELKQLGAAIACISAGPHVRNIASSVGIDDTGAGYDITRYLIDLGHRRFGYIHGIKGHLSAEGRYLGFVRALLEAGIGLDEVIAERGNFTFHAGSENGRRILERPDRPTALICANDDTAAGAMLAAHKLGLDIPGQVSIVGFDDTPVSEIVWPPLTTVHQPIREMGRRAVELVILAMTESDFTPRYETIAYHIAERDSAAAPHP